MHCPRLWMRLIAACAGSCTPNRSKVYEVREPSRTFTQVGSCQYSQVGPRPRGLRFKGQVSALPLPFGLPASLDGLLASLDSFRSTSSAGP